MVLFQLLSTGSLLAIVGGTYLLSEKSTKDNKKIERIADNTGLFVREGKIVKHIRLHRSSTDKKAGCTEYVYQIPLGLEFKDFVDRKQKFIDGLNNTSMHRLSLADFKTIKLDATILKQIHRIFTKRIKLDKVVEMAYDGMLKIRVYDQGLGRNYPFTTELLEQCHGWEVPIGYSQTGLIKHDFDKLQMLVVAGMTRYGKTVFLKSLITSLINNKPDDVDFTLVDLKGGLAFNRFAKCKQVKTVASSMKETLEALQSIHDELVKRQEEFKEKGYEDITEAKLTKRSFIIVDEGAEIASYQDKKVREQCTTLVGEIARIGAGLGYRMIFATQYPTADVFPRQVKANTSGALCFKLRNGVQSNVVIDRAGAEDLPTKLPGRAIYQTDTEVIVQTPYMTNEFIDKAIAPHIVIKARKGGEDNGTETIAGVGTAAGEYTTIFKET